MNSPILTVRFVDSARRIPQDLWESCFPPPLEGRWWYEALETGGLDDQFTFLYGVIHQAARPVGIAPAFLSTAPIGLMAPGALEPLFALLGKILPSLLCPRTLFVGSPCADEGTIGLLPGVDRRDAFLCLQAALEEHARELRAHMLVWKDMPGAYVYDLAWLLGRRRLFPVSSFPGTVVELFTQNKQDYFATLKGSRRHILKKKIRRSMERVDTQSEIVTAPDAETLAEIFGLFWQTYEKGTTKFEKLTFEFFERLAAASVSRFIVLREKQSRHMIAFMLVFEMGSQIINKFIGIDYRRPKEWLLYFRLWDAALDWALSRGAKCIQSGQTGYAAKIETGHSLVPLTNYGHHRNRLIHMIYAAVAKTIEWRSLDADLARFLKAHPDQALNGRPKAGRLIQNA